MKKWSLSIVFCLPFLAQAKIFKNAYISFEINEKWNCNLEQTEWVCRSQDARESKEAIIILTAKEVGPTDKFELYESHLKTVHPRPGIPAAGAKVSQPPQYKKINNQQWVDGIHLGSEMPNYFTRYVATIKDQIAILVTFTAHKDFYAKYSTDFIRSINSLTVIASKGLLDKPQADIRGSGGEIFGVGGVNPLVPGQADPTGPTVSGKKDSGKFKILLLGLGLLLIGAGLYLYSKSSKKK